MRIKKSHGKEMPPIYHIFSGAKIRIFVFGKNISDKKIPIK